MGYDALGWSPPWSFGVLRGTLHFGRVENWERVKRASGTFQEEHTAYGQPRVSDRVEREARLEINMAARNSHSSPSGLPSSHDATPKNASHAALESDVEQHEVDYDRPVSPFHMPPGQIDGLESLKADGFTNGRGQSPHRRDSNSSLLHLHIPGILSPAQLAFAAMQYLPYPMVVLNVLKTLVLANEAMGRLLDVEGLEGDTASDDGISALDRLKGQTLSQMGIDMLQDGRPVWVTWESFLDSLVEDMGTSIEEQAVNVGSENGAGDITPTAERTESFSQRANASKNQSVVHDAVVEVVLRRPEISASYFAKASNNLPKHTFAKMIITVWEIEDEKFFTLTFTATDSNQTSLPSSRGKSRQVIKSTKHRSLGSTSSGSASRSSPSSVSSGRSSNQGGSSNSSAITSPTYASMSASPFPPLGPPSRSTASGALSSLHKVVMMKEALLDNTEVPVLAMWKDGSLTIPNKAARRLFHPTADLTQVKDGADLVTKWHIWNETFTTRLDPAEYPISELIKTQIPFSSRKIGIFDPETDRKIVFDCLGEAIRDENTGEFLAGMVTCRDITEMTEQINEIKEKDEQRLQLICDSMPQSK